MTGIVAVVSSLIKQSIHSIFVMSEAIAVQPAAGSHAIEVMALAVEWDRHLTPDGLAQVEELYKNSPWLQSFLPRIDHIQGVSLQFGDDGTTVSNQESGGFQLQQIRENGAPSWTVSVRPDLIACNCLIYDRWDFVKPKAMDILLPIVEKVLALGHQIQAVGLQYQDSFRVMTESPLEATARLFRREGKWLSPHVWNTDGSWHIHQGWFSSAKSGRKVHNLLNIDFVSELDSGLIRINGQHRALAADFKGVMSLPYELEAVSSTLDGLHLDNKRALHNLLCESVCSQIGLTVPEEM